MRSGNVKAWSFVFFVSYTIKILFKIHIKISNNMIKWFFKNWP
jgi:hypothetical protein